MTFPQVNELFAYWGKNPPVHELLGMLARCYTTWQQSEAQTVEEHRRSLELRWAAGAMNPKQMFEAFGGVIPLPGQTASPASFDFDNPPGIGPFPGQRE